MLIARRWWASASVLPMDRDDEIVVGVDWVPGIRDLYYERE